MVPGFLPSPPPPRKAPTPMSRLLAGLWLAAIAGVWIVLFIPLSCLAVVAKLVIFAKQGSK